MKPADHGYAVIAQLPRSIVGREDLVARTANGAKQAYFASLKRFDRTDRPQL
jgi:hypothetical protein